MTPEFEAALAVAREAHKAYNAHLKACPLCVHWWGECCGCEKGGDLWYATSKAQDVLDRELRALIEHGDPLVKVQHKVPPLGEDHPAYGVADGTLPPDSPGYRTEWWLKKKARRTDGDAR